MELEETGGSTTRLRVVSSGRETVTLGDSPREVEALEWEELAELKSRFTENWAEETEDLEARGASELGWLEAQKLGLVVLGQLKGENRGSLNQKSKE